MKLALVLHKPNALENSDHLGGWFAHMARAVLNGTRLQIAGQPHRLTEVEFYYYGDGHRDSFAHRQPIQQEPGRWYFHGTPKGFRGGSFKGVDLTFGHPGAYGGILIRSLETLEGTLIDGPSLCVDHFLRCTGHPTVALLHRAVETRRAWEADNPLYLAELPAPEARSILRTARVGLNLRCVEPAMDRLRFILRPYRFLTEPRRIAKGKAQIILALLIEGLPADEIRKRTGSPMRTIREYIQAFEEGKREDPGRLLGAELNAIELCRLHGALLGRAGSVSDQRNDSGR